MKGSIKSSRAKCHRAHSDSSQDLCNHDASAANEGAGGREERVAMDMAAGRRRRRRGQGGGRSGSVFTL